MIEPGDIFFTTSPSALSKLINWGQELKSPDRDSPYSHCGVSTGGLNTYESLTTIRYDNLLKYVSEPFLIARPKLMDDNRYVKGMCEVSDMNGAIYPFHRLFLILAGLGRVSVRNWLVCSELVAKFLQGAGLRTDDYCGVTPDELHDEVDHTDAYDIVFEGFLDRDFFRKEGL